MTPTPQNDIAADQYVVNGRPTHGERVVISGMAGIYPDSENIKEFEDILYNKVNPISSEDLRWKNNHPEVAQFTGKVPGLHRFDGQFFKVAYRQGHNMDPVGRKLLEQAYTAIYDAGVNPDELNGKKVGVFIGTSMSETERMAFSQFKNKGGLGLTGTSKTMLANRISYWLNTKGPSLNIDESCCSSTTALEQAYQAIARGECEAAIVGGGHICLHPQTTVHLGRAFSISSDGKTKSYDQNASGIAMSEAVNTLYLQKAPDALRIYGEIVYAKCEFRVKTVRDSLKSRFYFDTNDSVNFLKDFYQKAGVPPSLVEYVDGFGAADPDTDKAELETFDAIFCKDRNEPLLVGSVMSNIGYVGAASGISAVTKILLGLNKGELAGNLHCDTPRSDVAALREGRIQIVNDHRRIRGTYAAVNNLSVTGVNGHVLIRGHFKPKDINRYKTNIPRLVNASGRNESAVKKILDELKSKPIDPEQLALLHVIHETKISGHLSRGFCILDSSNEQNSVSLSESVNYYDDTQRPLWFVYSGMGSQWAGMGAQLMRIPIFAAAIERCHRALEPKGIDIVNIITSPDKSTFDNILHSFVGIAAIQIGLTDVLKAVGLVPDKIIGHSVGELGCAYADGCFTTEEMILSAYSRGRVSLETPFIRGSMAAVGLGAEQMSKMCPPEIQIACHNSSESCTISGPAEVMRAFVADLTSKGIFAKEVPSSNIAFHSRYIAEAGPALKKYLKEIIPTPKPRSERWVSTSVPQNRWEENIAKYSSADYHTNNLLSPVLFEETSKLIPSNAVLVEIAPHGLLQAILKRSMPESCTNIPLTRRGHPDNVVMLLEGIGKLYMTGYNIKIRELYPKVDFPVSSGTPFLNHLVEMMHEESWSCCRYVSAVRKLAAECEYLISLHNNEHSFLKGHCIRNKILLPFSFVLEAVWDTYSMSVYSKKKILNVEFNNLQFYAQPILYKNHNNRIHVSIHKGNGRFEVINEQSRIATGYIKFTQIKNLRGLSEVLDTSDETFDLSTDDVYQLFTERDYFYSGEFRSIESANDTLTKANLIWDANWVTLFDGMIQLNALKRHHNSVSQLDQIGRITINVDDHEKCRLQRKNNASVLRSHIDDVQSFTRCGGIVIENINFHDLPPPSEDVVSLKSLKFVPRFNSNMSLSLSLQVIIQMVAENIHKDTVNVFGITDQSVDTEIIKEIKILTEENSIPAVKINYRDIFENDSLEGADLIVAQNLSNDYDMLQNRFRTLRSNTFFINKKSLDNKSSHSSTSTLHNIVSIFDSKEQNTRLELSQWKPTAPITTESSTTFTIRSESELPLLAATRKNLAPQDSLIILTSYPTVKNLKNIVNQWRTESTRNRVCLVMTKKIEEIEELPSILLAFNVIQEGICGGEYYLPPTEIPLKKEKIMLQSGQIGNLNSLQWVYAPDHVKNDDLVKVSVHYAGLNMNDVKRAAGAILPDNIDLNESGYGMEFSGLTESGEKVMGLVQNGAASSHVMSRPELLWPVPSHWTLEDAATVPFAYVYAYYCLNVKVAVRLIEKHVTQISILVHGGAGALGQAMISIALANGYKVFTTVSDVHKKRFLLRLFPQLHENDIGNSRDTSFGDMILKATDGKGCNIVLCCLKGELKDVSLKCCGSSGTTFDTILINNKENYRFGMDFLSIERAYIPVDISSIFTHMTSQDLKQIRYMLSNGIALGHVRPLTRVTYGPHEAPRAFRLLAASQHRGRVLLRMQELLSSTQPRLTCLREQSHFILSDTEHLGLQLADTLIARGATKITIHVPNSSTYLRFRLSQWEKLGVQVSVLSESLSSNKDISNMLVNVLNSGPLDGVFVNADTSSRSIVIAELDSLTRKLCPTLKYFVVLSENESSLQNTCSKRVRDGFPMTLLDLSLVKTLYNNDATRSKKVMEAVVLALRTSDPILLAQLQRSEGSLLQQIAVLTENEITKDIASDMTLKQLGIDSDKSLVVGALLRDKYQISLDEENIPLLTIEQLKQIDEKSHDPELKHITGLQRYFSYVDPDEMTATTEMIFLPTLTSTSDMRADEFNDDAAFMCIVPGLEGHYARFSTLCENLKLAAFVLQPGLDNLDETPQDLARRYATIIMKKTKVTETFNILGYETGVTAAIELATILEEHGKTGTVFCLGEGPNEMKDLLAADFSEFQSEEALQTAVVRHFYTLMVPGSMPPSESALLTCSSWQERVNLCVSMLLGRVTHSAQYARALMEAAYARIATARCYSVVPRSLRSRIVLLRAKHGTHQAEDCSLNRFSSGRFIVRDLEIPMPHVCTDLRVPAIINSYLDEQILEAFETRGLCKSYLLNGDLFMEL